MQQVLVTITGPSGSGKSTVSRILAAKHNVNELVSHTTRAKRDGEVEGKDYFFVTKEQFLAEVEAGNFVEAIMFNDNHYGLHADTVNGMEGVNCIVVEPHGQQILTDYCHAHDIPILRVFVDNELKELIARVLRRYKDDNNGDVLDYTSRLLNLIYVEAEHWRIDGSYDMVFEAYNGGNKIELPQEIMDLAVAAMMSGVEFTAPNEELNASGKGAESLYDQVEDCPFVDGSLDEEETTA